MSLLVHNNLAALMEAESRDRPVDRTGRLLIVGSGVSGMSTAAELMGSMAADEGIETVLVHHRGAATRRRNLRPLSARLDLTQAMRHRRRWRRRVSKPDVLRATLDRFSGITVGGMGPLSAMEQALTGVAARTLAAVDLTVLLQADQNLWPDTRWVRKTARAEQQLLAGFDRVAAVSSWCAWSLVNDYGLPSDRILVMPPCAPTSTRTPASTAPATGAGAGADDQPPTRPLRLVAVGRPAVRKGFDRLLSWLERRPDLAVEVHLVGSDAVSDDPRVVNHGWVDRDRVQSELLPSMDLLVHPTRRDQSSTAVVEAAMAGVPAVAMAMGGIPELIRHDETGWLVRADSRADLERQLDALMADRDRVRRAGRAAAAHAAATFDADATLKPVVRWLAGRDDDIVGARSATWGFDAP